MQAAGGNRARAFIGAGVGCAVALTLVPAPAYALTTCSTLAPAVGQTVVCTGAGTVDITVPDGALTIDVGVDGGGGGGGGSITGDAGGDGGRGARVSTELLVTSGTILRIAVGSGGAGGASGKTGGGGEFSAIYLGASTAPADALIVAGGGGGGAARLSADIAGSGGSGSALNTVAGGDGTGMSSQRWGQGAPGDGTGGSAAACDAPTGGNGVEWTSGGTGGGSLVQAGGMGGNGFGGGGAGARFSDTGGGGAGGSFAASASLARAATFSADGGALGAGGTPVGSAGSPGAVTFTFRGTLPSLPVAAPIFGLTWSHGDGTASTSTAPSTSWLATPGRADVTRPGQILLGWATSPAFPTERAVTATSVFDGMVGGVRMIFIPAGQQTQVTGDNVLHAVWQTQGSAPRGC